MDTQDGACFLFGSAEGLLVALDRQFRPVWKYQLPGKTTWSRALPVVVKTDSTTTVCIGDHSGTVTCLDLAGAVVWSKQLGKQPCRAILQTYPSTAHCERLFVPAGTILHCLDPRGRILWSHDLGGTILSRPVIYDGSGHRLILCGAGSGSLIALNMEGSILWKSEVGDEIDDSIAILERRSGDPMILCTGVGGNLYAFNLAGHPLWTHLFRTRTRSRPLIEDADGDGDDDILVTAYNQRVYVFDQNGNLEDTVRLSGLAHASPVPIKNTATGENEVLVVTKALLAHRLRPGPARSPYGAQGKPDGIRLHLPGESPDAMPGVVIDNPRGALIRVNVSTTDQSGRTVIQGRVTARSLFEIPVSKPRTPGLRALHVTISDPAEERILENKTTLPPFRASTSPPHGLMAWPTPAYASFDESRLKPYPYECDLPEASDTESPEPDMVIGPLWGGEVDQGALIVASGLNHSVRVLVTTDSLVRDDGVPFAGAITLRKVVMTQAINGEMVADALPAIGNAGVLSIPARRATKVWVSVDTTHAQPGVYRGSIAIWPLYGEVENITIPLVIHVLDLRLPESARLTLCTWDYVPQKWFSGKLDQVLNAMGRYGINVFPRSTNLPPARQNRAGGLDIDWTALDQLLSSLHGRGTILFQLGIPSVVPRESVGEPQTHLLRLEFLRRFRDHLREHGWGYGDYAFYPVDEPGLDHGKRVPQLLQAAKLFREADPKFRVYTDLVFGISRDDFVKIAPLIDVWCPEMDLVAGLLINDPRIAQIKNSGKTVWSYECFSQVKSLSPLRYNRGQAWRARFFGLDGIGVWTYAQTPLDLWFQGTGIEEYALAYPGKYPVPSVRLAAVRDGLEDIAALRVLDTFIAQCRQSKTNGAIADEAETAIRIAVVDMMELSDEAFIQSRDFLRKGDRRLWHTWTDVRMIQRHRDRIARLATKLARVERAADWHQARGPVRPRTFVGHPMHFPHSYAGHLGRNEAQHSIRRNRHGNVTTQVGN